tara:strand:+ start:35 stop:547 length:513 start_codon:yes stop_codon:yes gene_type:complete
MNEPQYFTPEVRCYSDGRVERKDTNPRWKNPKWRLVKLTPNRYGRYRIEVDKKYYFVYRIIASCFLNLDIENLEDVVDHRDGNPSNNRIENLRVTTKQGNSWNQVRAKGYTWHERAQKWQAQIEVKGKKFFLGLFDTEEEARQSYLAAKLIYHVIPERPINFPIVQPLPE